MDEIDLRLLSLVLVMSRAKTFSETRRSEGRMETESSAGKVV